MGTRSDLVRCGQSSLPSTVYFILFYLALHEERHILGWILTPRHADTESTNPLSSAEKGVDKGWGRSRRISWNGTIEKQALKYRPSTCRQSPPLSGSNALRLSWAVLSWGFSAL